MARLLVLDNSEAICLSLANKIGENSKNLIKQHYINSQICVELANFYQQLL